MIKEREEICEKCRMIPSIHDLGFPSCQQPHCALNQYEYDLLGVKPEDEITLEGVRKLMEISIRPYCLEKMLQAHPVEWWYKRMGGK